VLKKIRKTRKSKRRYASAASAGAYNNLNLRSPPRNSPRNSPTLEPEMTINESILHDVKYNSGFKNVDCYRDDDGIYIPFGIPHLTKSIIDSYIHNGQGKRLLKVIEEMKGLNEYIKHEHTPRPIDILRGELIKNAKGVEPSPFIL